MNASPHGRLDRAVRPEPSIRGRRILSAALLGFVVACGGGGSTDPRPGLLIGDAESWVCSGVDVSTLKNRVHVSSQVTSELSCGSPTQTCTIQQGIDRCSELGCDGVLVRHGLYAPADPLTITLRDGVNVYGGCRPGDEADRGYRTTIRASPKPGDPAIDASGIVKPTRIHGLVVVVDDRAVGEGASIAMRATSSPGLTLTRMVLSSGRGGDGVEGAAGTSGVGERGSDGPSGAAGGRACAAAPRLDGRGQGGQGGDGLRGGVDARTCSSFSGRCDCAYVNPNESIGRPGLASGSIAGGTGGQENSLGGFVCTNASSTDRFRGPDGGQGRPGACAAQGGSTSANLWGLAGLQGWRGGEGGVGQVGDVGSGGGGGTSGGFCLKWETIEFVQGVAAGGGGGGGCGGGGGAGGQQGGASIALLLTGADVGLEPEGVALLPAPGGRGGNGGPGVLGGSGGSGGVGGPWGGTPVGAAFSTFVYQCPGQSGSGGPGGDGGSGAGGAGGNGGPSINVALAASAAWPKGADGAYGGTPGLGGSVGKGTQTSHCTTPDGAVGVGGGAAAVVNFDSPPSNILSVNQRIAKGQSRVSPNGRVSLEMQTDSNLCVYQYASAFPTSPRNELWCSIQNENWINTAQYLVMQDDGNLCVYDSNDRNPTCTQAATLGHPGAYLSVEDDGHIVVRDGSLVLWSRPKAPS
jgi:hypothetical protein